MKFALALFAFIFFAGFTLSAQKDTTFTTKFIPREITYNASPNPKQCWEAVEYGIEIKVNMNTQFFSIAFKDIENLKQKIGDAEVQIEVGYFTKPEDKTGALGSVKQITMNGVVIYKQE
jgi:hypothetical protein